MNVQSLHRGFSETKIQTQIFFFYMHHNASRVRLYIRKLANSESELPTALANVQHTVQTWHPQKGSASESF